MSSGIYFSDPKSGIDRECVLLVEGQDDAYFFDALLDEAGADPREVGIVYLKGKDNLADNLRFLKKSRPFTQGKIRRLGITQDSDDSGAEALRAVQAALRECGLAIPGHGVFQAAADSPDVGVFILPSDQESGDLEKVCLATINGDDRLRRACQFLDEVEAAHGKLDKIFKRRALALFACVPVETRGVGRAFKSTNLFDRSHVSLGPIKDFVRQLIS